MPDADRNALGVEARTDVLALHVIDDKRQHRQLVGSRAHKAQAAN